MTKVYCLQFGQQFLQRFRVEISIQSEPTTLISCNWNESATALDVLQFRIGNAQGERSGFQELSTPTQNPVF
jgi:hypothetical protein